MCGVIGSEHPNVGAYWERLAARPGFRKALSAQTRADAYAPSILDGRAKLQPYRAVGENRDCRRDHWTAYGPTVPRSGSPTG
jgi:hypothetical protein